MLQHIGTPELAHILESGNLWKVAGHIVPADRTGHLSQVFSFDQGLDPTRPCAPISVSTVMLKSLHWDL